MEESRRLASAPAAPSVALFLRLVADRGLCRPGTGDYLRVERLLRSRERWTAGELAAALAALLATGEESWRRIHTLALDSLRLGGKVEREGATAVDEAGEGAAPTSPSAGTAAAATPASRQPWRQLLPAAALVVGILAVGFLVPVFLRQDPVEVSPPPPPAVEVPEEVESLWRLEELEAERVVEGSVRRAIRELGWRDGLAFAASFVLLALALRWWQLPGASRRHRQRVLDDDARSRVERREEERERGWAAREELARELLEAGESPLVPFQVPELPAVSRRAIDDAAVVLARLQEEIPGRDELDAEATVVATVEAGGRAVPVFERGRLQATLLVLVDDEGGDHPWLGGFQRVLDRWQKRGVRMLRFTFCEQPDPVWPYPRGAAVSFDVLSRRHAGLPLVIFSRRLTHRGVTAAGADWARRLEVWPVKAWIDPDPTPLGERIRRPGFAQDVRGLKRLGFARFGLDEQDLPMLARYLAEGGAGIVPPRRRPLPKITAEIEPALRAWAVAAARVPEAGWDLLEYFRSQLDDEVGRLLPERRHVALLIRWVNKRQGTPNRRHQAYLRIGDEEVERLRREQVASDRVLPMRKRLLARVARMLLKQLQATRPGEDLRFLELRWELKRAELELVESPDEAIERLAAFRGSAVDSLAERAAESLLAEGSLRGEQREDVVRIWRPSPEPRKVGAGVTPRELLGGQPALWRRAFVAAICALGLLGSLAASRWVVARDFTAGVREALLAQRQPGRADVLPRTSKLVRTAGLGETAQRPEMIEVPAGEFLMGSPETEEGRFRDETQHPVTITRSFYLARTEVTQSQYQAVVGLNTSSDQQCGGDCPIESVSWLDAVRYANRLSEIEGLEACYEIAGEQISWSRGLDCVGYRLPTETEWEYAARAGTSDRYAGTDDPQDVCRYANVSTAFGCDDGHSRLAPVASFQPNVLELYDMTGNVWEWVWDWFDDYDGEATDPVGPESGRIRVFRGGSFFVNPRNARVAIRLSVVPSIRISYLGFRVARSLP